MRILVDTNIILDWLQKREPFFSDAKKIIQMCLFGRIEGFVSSHSLCDLFFILRKDFSTKKRMSLINLIASRFAVIEENYSLKISSEQNFNFANC